MRLAVYCAVTPRAGAAASGGIPIAAILNRLPEMVYSIELPHLARAREFGYAEHAFRCLESAKAYAAANPRR